MTGRSLSTRTVGQVTAALDGCDHDEVRPDGQGSWTCVRCDQWFGPIFHEEIRSHGVTIAEAMRRQAR